MMHVTLRQLRAFEAVARLRSFSRAAEEMHVTQPTVSKQIRLLQEQVGLPLLEQLGKKIFLTEAGQGLYATCADWLETWGRFEQTIDNLKGLKQGRLRIAAVTTTKYFMPRILGPFCAQYPGIDIALEVVNRDRLLDRLTRNQDDLYIMGVPPEGLDTESESFLDNPLVVLAPITHHLVGRKQIPFAELAEEPFLVRERGSGTRMTMERVFQERGTPLHIKMDLGSNEAIKQAVVGGLGLAMLSRSTLNLDPSQQELAELDVEGFPLVRAWYVVRPKGKQLSVVAATFLEFLRGHVQLFVRDQDAGSRN
ncbi:LysR family transcriptional regulator [Thiorhodococcus mannitoliphagus]|uniref:LysR family transcriptional regulator n=1 Tax=Thiorhodococcus mannitoliphagus TaxID=329406 RepID=A0A6P1DY79_9GAMM|nr:LysR family transcriptional regulator [Thiorhodococcus mannitoliphagus]NEX23158.1 LysR family transcriptional regulator [Thiorhodococcus mannitoliphagus]